MGDKVTIIDTAEKKSRLESFLKGFSVSLDVIASRLGPVSTDRNIYTSLQEINSSITSGFAAVAAEIAKLKLPEPPPASDDVTEATIVARYKFNEDQGPIEYPIVVTDFKSAKGTPVGGDDIDVTIESSSAQLGASFSSGPTLSDDKSRIDATVRLEGQAMPVAELAVVAIRAKNRDTGSEVAADLDEFETGPGEVAIGTISTPVPLDEVVEEPPV